MRPTTTWRTSSGSAYLTTAQVTFADSEDATASRVMVEAYPDRLGSNLLDFGADRPDPRPEQG